MRNLIVLFVLCALSSSAGAAPAGIQLSHLRCEYLVEPLGVHEKAPRLSWVLESARRGERQSAYEVLVASSTALLAKDQGDLWSSGKVASAESAHVVYAGKALGSRQECWWKVRVWGGDGRPSAWSRPARWEMGLLAPADWTAKWIDASAMPDAAGSDTLSGANWIWSPEPGADLRSSAPTGERFFRRRLTLAEKPRQARLTISVDDTFILTVNGKEVGRVAETDGWRTPRRYDLTPLLAAGENVLAVAATNTGSAAGVCARLVIETAGQAPQVVVSDRQWKASAQAGEGWTASDFNDAGWKSAAQIVRFGQGVWGSPGAAGAGKVPLLRRAVKLADKPVAKARLFVTALGLYEMSLNGKRVGDYALAPEWTDYTKRVRYQAYDVTPLLRKGENVLGAMLANGWYSGKIGNGGFQWRGTTPALLAQFEVTYADGTSQRVATDDAWKAGAGPVVSSDFMLGEAYDARKEVAGWDEPGLDDGAWAAAVVRDETPRPLEGQVMEPVRAIEELKPKALKEPQPGRWTFDLGQNMVGVVRLRVSAPAGTTVTLRHAEMLNPDGTIYTANLRGAPSVDTYTCKGGGVETWQPHFAFHGFRYVEVTGLPAKPAADAITGIVLGSDTPRTGEFTCSDPRINQLQSNIWWGQRGNYLSVPTDCPQRDERLGWMGDAEVFVRTATFNADVAAFFTKWMVDVDDAQTPDGAFTDVSPRVGSNAGTPAWADAGVICPWTIYQAYGDRRILEQHYPAMVRWVEWCRAHSKDLIRERDRGADYGDWLAIGSNTPKDVIGTAYFAYSTSLVAKAAKALGRSEDAAKYEQLFRDIQDAFNKRYVAADGRIQGNTQCVYAMALKFGLLPEEMQAKAAQYLEEDIRAKGWHLSTGFVGVSYLLPVLTRAGKLDTAYRLMMQDTFPSWLFSVKQGATTIWERWDGWTPEKGFQNPGMNSFNHYSLGSCGEWLFDTVAGIATDPDQPGFRHILIRPRPGGGLTSASGSLLSIRGRIASAWRLQAGTLTLDVTIPANTTATVWVPAKDAAGVTEGGKPAAKAEGVKFLRMEDGAAVYEVVSGSYRFAARQ